jgi:hypothetical protein
VRAHPPRGEPRLRPPQRDDPEAARRRASRRHADGARGRVHRRPRLGRWLASTAGPMQMLYACDNVTRSSTARSSTSHR